MRDVIMKNRRLYISSRTQTGDRKPNINQMPYYTFTCNQGLYGNLGCLKYIKSILPSGRRVFINQPIEDLICKTLVFWYVISLIRKFLAHLPCLK